MKRLKSNDINNRQCLANSESAWAALRLSPINAVRICLTDNNKKQKLKSLGEKYGKKKKANLAASSSNRNDAKP